MHGLAVLEPETTQISEKTFVHEVVVEGNFDVCAYLDALKGISFCKNAIYENKAKQHTFSLTLRDFNGVLDDLDVELGCIAEQFPDIDWTY